MCLYIHCLSIHPIYRTYVCPLFINVSIVEYAYIYCLSMCPFIEHAYIHCLSSCLFVILSVLRIHLCTINPLYPTYPYSINLHYILSDIV